MPSRLDNQIAPAARPDGDGMRALGSAVQFTIRLLMVALCLLLAISLFRCYVVVKQHQTGIVYRFGKPHRYLKPGQHALIFPPPIDTYQAYTLTREKTLGSKAFTFTLSEQEKATGLAESVPATLRPGVDGYLLTGDRNIVHCTATLYYRVAEPMAFYEQQSDGESMLRRLFDDALIRAAAALGAETVLFDVAGFSEAVRARLVARCEQLELGIAVNRVVLKASPPRQVKAAFDEHVAAGQATDQLRQEARTYRTRVLNETESEANRLLAVAQASKVRMVQSAQARADTYSKLLEQYRLNPGVVRRELYLQTLRRVTAKAEECVIVQETEGRQIRVLMGRQAGTAKESDANGDE